jgi:hypothetical protein
MIAARCGLLLLAMLASGCVSIVSVEKSTTAKKAGVTFNLPEVFIQVARNADGKYEIRKHFIPDPAQEYVVSTTSIFGNYTIDIQRGSNNLLESVSFETDTTAVAKQAIESATAVRVARIEAAAARAKADADAAKAASDKALAALEDAEKAAREADLALKVAEGRLALVTDRQSTSGSKAAVLQAEIAVDEAKVRQQTATSDLDKLRLRYKAPTPIDRAEIPADALRFYRVRMTRDTVELQEMSAPPKR